MMAAGDEELLSRAAQDEFKRNARAGDRVLVRKRRSGSPSNNWYPGRVDDTAGKGVYVTADHGEYNFYRWTDVRRDPAAAPRAKRLSPDESLETIVAKHVARADATEPPPAPPETAPKADPTEITVGDPTVAEMFVRWRKALGSSQAAACLLVDLEQTHLSRIERGAAIPSDDVLISFAEVTGIDVALLLAARDKQLAPLAKALAEAERPFRGLNHDEPELDGVAAQMLALLESVDPYNEGATASVLLAALAPDTDLHHSLRLLTHTLGSKPIHSVTFGKTMRSLVGIQSEGRSLQVHKNIRGTVWTIEYHGGPKGFDAVAIPEPAPAPEPAPPATTQENYLEWSERVKELIPVPKDRSRRKRWFVLMRELWEISGKEI